MHKDVLASQSIYFATEDKQSESEEAQAGPRFLVAIQPAYVRSCGVPFWTKNFVLSIRRAVGSDEVFSKVSSSYQSCE